MEILPILTKWAEVIRDSTEASGELRSVGFYPEAQILIALNATTAALTASIEVQIGIKSPGWLDWYSIENDMGDRALMAGYDDDLREIRTLGDLAWLVARELSGNEKSRDGHSTTGPTEDSNKEMER